MPRETRNERNEGAGTDFAKLIVVGLILLFLYLLGSAASNGAQVILLGPFLMSRDEKNEALGDTNCVVFVLVVLGLIALALWALMGGGEYK